MSNKPFISIVIPTFNRKDLLEMVLDSLNNQTYPSDRYEVIVSDSNSTDGTAEMIKKFSMKGELKYISEDKRGRARARNIGINEAQGDIVLFTDADIIASENLLEEHAMGHEKYPGEAIVGLEQRIASLDEYKYLLDHPKERKELHPSYRKKISWLYFITGNASVPRDKLIKAGMFDEDFQGYGWEDIELGYRLAKNGVSINYWRNAVNYHIHKYTFSSNCDIMTKAGKSAVRFYRKYRDWKIRYLLGMNPFVMALHSLLSPDSWIIRNCEKRADREGFLNKFCTDLLLQYHYLNGVKEELGNKGF